MAAREPAYRRLDVDERRRRLLELGAELFSRHTYAELSMSAIARAAGISKALLYHYFPSKQAYFVATLEQQAEELAALTAVDPSLPAPEQLTARAGRVPRLGGGARRGLREAARRRGTHAEVRELVEQVRAATADADPRGAEPGRAAAAGAARRRARLAVVHGRRPERLAASTATSAATGCSTCCSAR